MLSRIALWGLAGAAVAVATVTQFENPAMFRWKCGPVFSEAGFQHVCRVEPDPRLKALFRARNRYQGPSRPRQSARPVPA